MVEDIHQSLTHQLMRDMGNDSSTLLADSKEPSSVTAGPDAKLMVTPSKENNFDAIRLIAALQVASTHLANYLGIESQWIRILEYFPGVPIFFFISGFLIFQSYASTRGAQRHYFFMNRALRLFPGLAICTVLTLMSIELSGYHVFQEKYIKQLLLLVTAHSSIFQFYNPEFLRGYGSGAINGSLWTIGVEIQFYILTPILFFFLTKHRKIAAVLFGALILANIANNYLNDRQSIAHQLIDYSFTPWFYMFAFGAFLSTQKAFCTRIVKINLLYLLTPYLICYYASGAMGFGSGNSINPICFILLSAIIVKCAYSCSGFSDKILHRNDISYGVYIYHMPVINYFLQTKIIDGNYAFVSGLFLTLAIATSSWLLIEKPCIRLKRRPNRKLHPATA